MGIVWIVRVTFELLDLWISVAFVLIALCLCDFRPSVGRREKTPTPNTRVSVWTLLRTPGRFTTSPPPSLCILSKTGRFLSKAEILGLGVFSPLPIQVRD